MMDQRDLAILSMQKKLAEAERERDEVRETLKKSLLAEHTLVEEVNAVTAKLAEAERERDKAVELYKRRGDALEKARVIYDAANARAEQFRTFILELSRQPYLDRYAAQFVSLLKETLTTDHGDET